MSLATLSPPPDLRLLHWASMHRLGGAQSADVATPSPTRSPRHRHARQRCVHHRRQPQGHRARLAPAGVAQRVAIWGQVHWDDLSARHRRLRCEGPGSACSRQRGRAAQSRAAQGDPSGHEVRSLIRCFRS
jgi:hypothetical protein